MSQQTMLDAVAGAVEGDRLQRHLREFARRVKLSGTPEGSRATAISNPA